MVSMLTRDGFAWRGRSEKSRNKEKRREVKFHIENEEKEKVLEQGQCNNRLTKAARKPL